MTDEPRRLALPAPAGAVLLSRDASLLVVGTRERALLLDAATLVTRREIELPPRTTAGALTPDGRVLVTGDAAGSLTAWDTANGARLRTAKAHDAPIDGIAASARAIACAAGESGVALLDADTLRVRARALGDAAATSLAFSRDGRTLAVGLPESPILLLESDGGAERSRIVEPLMASFALSFDASGTLLAAAGAEKTVFVFRAATGARVARFTGHDEPVAALALADDGSAVASAGLSVNPAGKPASARLDALGGARPSSRPLGVSRACDIAFAAPGRALAARVDGRDLLVAALDPSAA